VSSAELYLLFNFIADYVLLYAAARLSDFPASSWRLGGGAAVGALLSLVGLVHFHPLLIPGGFLLTCLAAYGSRSWRSSLRASVSFLALSALAGGLSLLIPASRSASFLATFLLVAALGLASAGAIMRGRVVPLTLEVGEKRISLQALVDSGNRLRDPLSRDPVLLCSWEAVRKVVPEEFSAACREGDPLRLAHLGSGQWGRRVRLIPALTASGERLLLPGFRPDRVYLSGKRMEGLTVAVSPRSFGDRFQALLPPGVLE
jgi:stage II sporulation protein GA (sporulation sigma-E factor processing peptidase)